MQEQQQIYNLLALAHSHSSLDHLSDTTARTPNETGHPSLNTKFKVDVPTLSGGQGGNRHLEHCWNRRIAGFDIFEIPLLHLDPVGHCERQILLEDYLIHHHTRQ